MVPLVLIIIAALLIFINIKFGDKENGFLNFINLNNNNSKSKKSNDFKNELSLRNINFTNEQQAIGQIRQDIAESLTEIQKDIINLNTRIDLIEKNDSNNYSKNDVKIEDEQLQKGKFKEVFDSSVDRSSSKKEKSKNLECEGVINDISLDNKSLRIRKMLDKGISIDEICEKLSVGKGEVLLVKGLYKK